MGIEVQRDGTLILLVLDPSHSPQQMSQFGDTNAGSGALRLLRKNEASMKARQYEIVAVVGTIDSEQQYQVNCCNNKITPTNDFILYAGKYDFISCAVKYYLISSTVKHEFVSSAIKYYFCFSSTAKFCEPCVCPRTGETSVSPLPKRKRHLSYDRYSTS